MMSKLVTIPPVRSYPVFESNQVLMKDHLNDLVTYLEGEIKITRRGLIGMGILTGLEYEVPIGRQAITILPGTAITSDGFVVGLDESKTYLNAIAYTDKEKLKLEHLPADDEEVHYYELVEEGHDELLATETTTIDINQLLTSQGDFGLVLFLDEQIIDFKSCFTTTCDDRGQRKDLVLRAILIRDGRSNPAPIDPNQHDENPELALPDFSIKRAQFIPNTTHDFPLIYKNLCTDQLLSQLGDAIAKAYQTYRYLFPVNFDPQTEINTLDLVTMREDFFNSRPNFMQYFYDFVIDLIQAYHEFKGLAFQLRSLNDMPHGQFSRHVILGPINNDNLAFHRTHFKEIAPDHDDRRRLDELHQTFKRMLRLSFSFKVPPPAANIAITPSTTRSFELSSMAIPYYYSDMSRTRLFKFWSHRHTKSLKFNQVLSYHNERYNHAKNEAYLAPLEYYHDDKDFLRIEGILKKPALMVINQLLKIRQDHHLPFDLVILRVNDHVNHGGRIHSEVPEFNFDKFIKRHPGLVHKAGVTKGRYFALVVDFSNEANQTVVADFELPIICCEEEKAYQLIAIDDEETMATHSTVDIEILDNDTLDSDAPFEIELIVDDQPLDAVADEQTMFTWDSMDIQILDNDIFDPNAPIKIDFYKSPEAKNKTVDIKTQKTKDIKVLDPNYYHPDDDVSIDIEKNT